MGYFEFVLGFCVGLVLYTVTRIAQNKSNKKAVYKITWTSAMGVSKTTTAKEYSDRTLITYALYTGKLVLYAGGKTSKSYISWRADNSLAEEFFKTGKTNLKN